MPLKLKFCLRRVKVAMPNDPRPTRSFFVVGIGASAGGLDSFQKLFTHLPTNLEMAFVVVQHLEPTHLSQLAQILSQSTSMPVKEVKNNTKIEARHVFIIPPNKKMIVVDGVLKLAPKVKNLTHPEVIDCFFKSLAEDKKSKAIGIILSGNGHDGTKGLTEIKSKGGITFAQDQSAEYGGMPQMAIASGDVDYILSVQKIAAKLRIISKNPPVDSRLGPMPTLLWLVQKNSGIDFSRYKQNTLKRRILRRMSAKGMKTLKDYIELVESNPSEIELLTHDLLIKVTSFFRDPKTFEELKNSVLPDILKSRNSEASKDLPLKIWVPGCSTGEEVYSLAILALEVMGKKKTFPIQIFGTDISELAIHKARLGVYSKAECESISSQRLKRFFIRKGDSFRISKAVRDICVFAQQNVTSDPPFSSLDLISCRNLLIYFQPILQSRVIPLFHYALKPTGYLILGSSESLGSFQKLFHSVSKKHKIFSKKMLTTRHYFDFFKGASDSKSLESPKFLSDPQSQPERTDFVREVDKAIVGVMAPAGVVINDSLEIIQIRGHIGDFLEPPPGKITNHFMKMLRPSLRADLHQLLQIAQKKRTRVRKDIGRYRVHHRVVQTSIEVIPLKIAELKEKHFLVLFDRAQSPSKGTASSRIVNQSERGLVAELRQELVATQNYLQSVVDSEQTLNEELKTTNEEVLSSNEEFQSTNEELETAKEELQSTNEELKTLNDELQGRNHQLTDLNDDLDRSRKFSNAIIQTIRLPIVVLDQHFVVTLANQCFYETFVMT